MFIARICPNSVGLAFPSTLSVFVANVSWFYPGARHPFQERGH